MHLLPLTWRPSACDEEKEEKILQQLRLSIVDIGSRKSKLFSVKAEVASIHWLLVSLVQYNQKLERMELNPVVDSIPKVRYTM